ncbi:MAG: M23 family metallopeptidase [Clostridia bacterium]|nr:M23 family metallopeptidase [Clostridia bacterium]
MEKKIKFSENPRLAKIVYGIVIAVLCITAIIIGIVAANNRDTGNLPDTPPADEGGSDSNGGTQDGTNNNTPPADDTPSEPKPEKLQLISPVSGTVATEFSLTVPVFSPTLEEWRVHAGIDILTEEAAPVFAAADGTVSEICNDPRYGYTVKIDHGDGTVSVYSNLCSESEPVVAVGDKVECGDRIATVGDSAVYEMADEAHLHFEVIQNGTKIDPLSIISEESKKASLGINAE